MDRFIVRQQRKRKIETEPEDPPSNSKSKAHRETRPQVGPGTGVNNHERYVLAGVNVCKTCTSVNNNYTESPSEMNKSLSPSIILKRIVNQQLNCDYGILYNKADAKQLFHRCEKELQYNTGDLATVVVYGKRHQIPRKQVAHGDEGLNYTFSGVTVPARPWTPLLQDVRDRISKLTGHTFNFVLINRYKDGNDYMGEHRDDEKDLDRTAPIASVSLGQPRDFIFRHKDSRGKNAKCDIAPVKIELANGSLLMMNCPTNQYWYHSLPKRANAIQPRINMTFRKMVTPVKATQRN